MALTGRGLCLCPEAQLRNERRRSVMTAAPLLTLNNGVTLPALGFGVFQSAPEETAAAVEAALAIGYRHVDTAAVYSNEREVGEGIRRSGIDRSEVFIETKVWISDYGYEQTLHAFDKSARKLGVDQIDLLILHQPLPSAFDKTVASYQALEKLLAAGKVRAIGVSNFTTDHLKALLERTEIVPAVNQIELHPYFVQRDMQQAHAEHGILTQAWSPIGGVTFYPDILGLAPENRTSTLTEPVIRGIADAYGKTAAQVMLAWHLQQGRSAIPKSVKPERIAENFNVFDIVLGAGDMAALDALDKGVRNGPDPEAVTLEIGNWPIPEA
ncbi:aldo/keto reductase [Micromonospora sp. NPDC047707]|uniref:aldo/keto reductase n=1 Tax=Micromonospora sp. NPDC047707 TaxID=3154498 RepID=UPI00345704D5